MADSFPTSDGPVLITGATGLLGHWLLNTAQPAADIVALAHQRPIHAVRSVQADLRDLASTTSAFYSVRPSLVLHAAYAKGRESIVDATRNVVGAAHACGAPVVFMSTDAVFSGDGSLRDEGSVPDPIWDYGRWKVEAEQIVVEQSAQNCVVRLPLLISVDPDDPTVNKIRTGAAAAQTTQWYHDEIRQPALASEVAAALWRIAALVASERGGFWHLTGARSMSRFELASWVVDTLNLPASTIESVPQPPGSGRPSVLTLSASRAQSQVDWYPTELGSLL